MFYLYILEMTATMRMPSSCWMPWSTLTAAYWSHLLNRNKELKTLDDKIGPVVHWYHFVGNRSEANFNEERAFAKHLQKRYTRDMRFFDYEMKTIQSIYKYPNTKSTQVWNQGSDNHLLRFILVCMTMKSELTLTAPRTKYIKRNSSFPQRSTGLPIRIRKLGQVKHCNSVKRNFDDAVLREFRKDVTAPAVRKLARHLHATSKWHLILNGTHRSLSFGFMSNFRLLSEPISASNEDFPFSVQDIAR